MAHRILVGIIGMNFLLIVSGCAQTHGWRESQRNLLESEQSDRIVESTQRAEEAEHEASEIQLVNDSTLETSPMQQDEIDRVPHDSGLPPSSAALTLADLEAIALCNNPTLRQAAAAIEVQRGQYLQSGLYPNPQVG